MGQGIVYCTSCGLQILESDFERGRARTLQGKNYCKNCVKEAAGDSGEKHPPAEGTSPTGPIPRRDSPTVRGLARPGDSSRRRPGDTGRIPKVTPSGFLPGDPVARIVFLVLAALLVAAAVVIIFFMTKSEGPK